MTKHIITAVNGQQLLSQVDRIEAVIGGLEIGWGTDLGRSAGRRWWMVERGTVANTGMSFSELVAAIQNRIERKVHALEAQQ